MSQESSWPGLAVTCARLVWPSRVPEEVAPQDVGARLLPWSEDPSKSHEAAALASGDVRVLSCIRGGTLQDHPVILLRVQCQ